MMKILPWVFGHSGPKQPYLCTVKYISGVEGSIALWAEDIHDALRQVHDVLPEHTPAARLTLELREES